MNCKEAQQQIAALSDDRVPDQLAAHVRSCATCTDLLSADARFRAALRQSCQELSPMVLSRIHQEIATPSRRSWLESLGGNTLMKITVPATAALALALAIMTMAPLSASAATPGATFAKMKKAVLAKAKQVDSLGIRIGKKDDGSIGTWVVVDGQLTEVPASGTYHTTVDGKDVTVMTSTPDLSKLPPDVQAQVQKALADAIKNGTGVMMKKFVVNGQEVDEETAHKLLQEQGIDLNISIDLNEGDYKSIAFGADRNHLVLSPKAAKDRKYVVTLDPKTELPSNVVLERLVKGQWVTAKQENVTIL